MCKKCTWNACNVRKTWYNVHDVGKKIEKPNNNLALIPPEIDIEMQMNPFGNNQSNKGGDQDEKENKEAID